MKVLRKTDRVKFKANEIEFTIAPLGYRDRVELSTLSARQGGESTVNYIDQTLVLTKKCLKGAKGLKDYQGKDYNLSFEGEELTEECAEEIVATLQATKAMTSIVEASLSNLSNIEDVTVLGK